MYNYAISYTSILYTFHFAIVMVLTFYSFFIYFADRLLKSIVILFTSFNSRLHLG
jgi:hypothetical protein